MNVLTKVAISTGLFGLLCTATQAATITVGSLTGVTSPGNVGAIAPGSNLLLGDVGSPVNVLGLNPNLYNASTTAPKTFFDDFVFTLPASSSLYSVSASLDSTALAGIGGFSESLYFGGIAGSAYSAVGTNPLLVVNLIGSPTSSTLSFANLAAGTYTLQFSGTLAAAITKSVLESRRRFRQWVPTQASSVSAQFLNLNPLHC
jgi:hypothetical protein